MTSPSDSTSDTWLVACSACFFFFFTEVFVQQLQRLVLTQLQAYTVSDKCIKIMVKYILFRLNLAHVRRYRTVMDGYGSSLLTSTYIVITPSHLAFFLLGPCSTRQERTRHESGWSSPCLSDVKENPILHMKHP